MHQLLYQGLAVKTVFFLNYVRASRTLYCLSGIRNRYLSFRWKQLVGNTGTCQQCRNMRHRIGNHWAFWVRSPKHSLHTFFELIAQDKCFRYILIPAKLPKQFWRESGSLSNALPAGELLLRMTVRTSLVYVLQELMFVFCLRGLPTLPLCTCWIKKRNFFRNP